MGRYRRYVIALAVIVVVLGLYAAAGFLGVPYLTRKNLQSFVHDHYGRTLALGDIRFNPFTLNLELTKLSLPDADGQPLLAFQRLQVDLQWATLWRLGPSFGTIILEEPYVRAVIRRDGELNLADLGKGFAPAPAPPPPPEQKSKPMRLYIGRLAVIAGTAALEDRTRPTPFRAELKPIGFELRDFSTTAKTGDAYALYAESPDGERLTWNGTLHSTPFASRGVFEIASLKAHTVWTYLRDSVPFEVDSGVINVKGDYEVASPAGGPLQVSVGVGSIAVTQLGVKPRGGPQHYIDVARIEVDGTRIDVAKHAVNVAKVELSGGDIRAWLEQGKLNLMQLAPGAGAVAAPAAAASADPAPRAAPASAAPPAWSVQAPDISVTGFKVSAEDREVQPAAAVVLQPLNIHVAGFNLSPEDTLDIALDSGVNGSGKLRATAKVTPKSGALSAHVESSELELAMLQPYIGQYTSMTLLKGSLGVKLDVERRADGALAVKGDTRILDLRTVDDALHQDFIKWKDLRVADLRYASAPASLKIGTVTAVEPYVRMIIAPDRSVNITRVLTPPGAAPKPAADAPQETTPPEAAAPGHPAAAKAPPPAAPPKPLTPFP
ncbi:MAG TPA: DUF748 domain-containing protein, partial [Steroidobacteraceae bacterium]|nr:DUF748 domain-containing protein [Steroidobacteraceae bacterium]